LESDGSVRIGEFSLGRRVRELVSLANRVRLVDRYPPSPGRGGKKSDIFRLGLVLASLAAGRQMMQAGLWIRIDSIRIRIQHFCSIRIRIQFRFRIRILA
jgi:hypothetical protein